MVEGVRVTARTSEATCGYCKQPLGAGPIECPACGVGQHPGCRLELGRCPTLGCPEARPGSVRVRPATTRSSRWPWVLAAAVPIVATLAFVFDHGSSELPPVQAAGAASWRPRIEPAELAERARVERAPPAVLPPWTLEVPARPRTYPPLVGQRVAEELCDVNGLALDVEELRRLLTRTLLRAAALRAGDRHAAWRPGARFEVDLLARRTEPRGSRATRFPVRVIVVATSADSVTLGMSLGRVSDWTTPLRWSETWPLAALQAELGPVERSVSTGGGLIDERLAAVDADGTRVAATSTRSSREEAPALPDLLRLERQDGPVLLEVELRTRR